jgi:hypothetical protein
MLCQFSDVKRINFWLSKEGCPCPAFHKDWPWELRWVPNAERSCYVLLCLVVLPITSSELSRSLLSNVNDIVLFYNIIWWRYQLYSIWTALWTFLEAFLIRSRIFLQARTGGTGGKSKSIKASGPVHAKTHQGFRWIDLDGLHYALSKNKSSRYLSNLA